MANTVRVSYEGEEDLAGQRQNNWTSRFQTLFGKDVVLKNNLNLVYEFFDMCKGRSG